jgi:hypothetical protein
MKRRLHTPEFIRAAVSLVIDQGRTSRLGTLGLWPQKNRCMPVNNNARLLRIPKI